MTNPSSKQAFEERLHAGGSLFGIFACIPTFQTAEILSHSDMDFICLEAEPAATNPATLHQQVAAVGARKPVVVRVASEQVELLKPILDLGVDAIMVPNVHTAEQARNIVALTRFAPEGKRGIGGSVRAARFGLDKSYYGDNKPPLVIVQIESREGLTNIEDIAAVDGVDAVFFGPNDLAAQLGFRGQPDAPVVRAAIENGMRKATSRGVKAGCLVPHWQSFGATIFLCGSDIGVLLRGTNSIAATLSKGL